MSLLNSCRSLLNVSGNCLKNTGLISRQIHKLPFKWVRPEVPLLTSKERSGDLGLDTNTKPTDYAFLYDQSETLANADETTKKLFTLELLPRKSKVQVELNRIRDLVKRHNFDNRSTEAQLAAMTCEILQLQEHMERHPRNKKSKVFLIHMIDKRAKLLKRLRIWDYRRFEWILEKLNLVYKPRPTEEEEIGPFRKPALRKLVKEECDKVIQKKLSDYKAELQMEQLEFFKEKAEKLAFIRSQEILYGLTPTVTEEEIESATKKAEELSLNAPQHLEK